MKAVIMAGGEGRRLRSVTGELPKPMAPMLGRPMMEHILLLLKKHGFAEVCAAVKYRAEAITEYFGAGSRLGVALQYRVEKEALGTAGGVKNCADFYGDEDFLVISGDAACDLDLGELMRRHRAGGAAATIALYREAEPLSYGLAVTDGGGLVRAFVEKPRWSRVVTDHVNTGIYALSPRAMELVPPGKPFDFANDLFPLLLARGERSTMGGITGITTRFPLLLARGERILGTALDGYWCDVGTPLSYYRCCVDALEGRLALDLPEGFAPAAPPESADAAEGCAACLDCACRSRAELMGALSEALLDMGADYSDGIRLRGGAFDLHIAPLSASSAIRISVSSEDAEFARELAASAKELAEAYDL